VISTTLTKSGWKVRIGKETVTVKSVVNAAGAWGDGVGELFGAAALRLQSYRRTVAIARPSFRQVASAWSMVSNIDSTLYFRPEGEEILMSPSDETLTPPCDVRPKSVDLDAVRERINEVTDLGILKITRSWSGLRTFAPDHLPVVGFDSGTPNYYWLVGQGGYGIQTAAAMAQLVAADLLGNMSDSHAPLARVLQAFGPERLT
jgi:D-arginine dehydrogenase